MRGRHRPGAQAAVPRRAGGPQQVRAAARRRQRDEHVARAPVGGDLAGEHLVVAVVVAYGRQARGLGGERQGGERGTLAVEAPDQLAGQVLGERGAAAVAGHEQAGAALEPPPQRRAPGREAAQLAPEGVEAPLRGGQVVAERRHHGRAHAGTAQSRPAAGAGVLRPTNRPRYTSSVDRATCGQV